jgi:hypothetical protein
MLLLLLLVVVAASHGDSSGETYDSSMCLSDSEPYTCGGMSFSYPFYHSTERKELNGYQNSCGYPGMGIVCEDDKPILQLDGGENYTVKSNDGVTATLADPEVLDNPCPRVDHNVTFAEGSWLDYPASTVDYLVFFLGCDFGSGVVQPPIVGSIICPGFASYYPGKSSFVFPDESVPDGNWRQECEPAIKVPVLKYGPVNPNDTAWRTIGYGDVLRQGFQVSWEDKKPSACAQCEQSNGQCTYRSTGEFLGCFCTDGQINAQDCTSVADKSTSKHFSIKHPISSPKLPVNYSTWCFRKLVVDYVIRSYGYLVQLSFQYTY